MLSIKNISKSYGKTLIFDKISFEVNKGEVISIIGSSGCGKSTLLKCINRLENITTGSIYLNGEDISTIDLVKLRKNIGIVFQDYNLFEHLTVLDNLTIGLIKIKNIPKRQALTQAIKLLKKVGLEEKKDNYPCELSGGQKQRVAIARTLLMKPNIILLDEPTSALDKEMKKDVLKLINDLVKENMTLIIVSHEEEFIKKVSNKIFKLNKHELKRIK